MKGIPAWLFLGGIAEGMAGGQNGRNRLSTRIWHTNPPSLVFLTHTLPWPPKAVKTNCKTGWSFKHLLVFDLVLYFKRKMVKSPQSRQGARLDTVPLPCLFPLSTSCWDLMWSQLTTPCLWLTTRKSPGVHVCANQSAGLMLWGLNHIPWEMGTHG